MTSGIRGHALVLSLLLVLSLSTSGALAQAGGSSGAGGVASRGGGTPGGIGSPAARVGPSGTSGSATSASDPRSLGNQPATAASPGATVPGTLAPGGAPAPAGTTTPSGTAYPSGAPLEAARQRALQAPSGTAIPPSAAGVGADRNSTSDVGVGSDSATEATTPGLPDQASPDPRTSGDPARATAGGRAVRQGAVGKSLAECEATWDAETHMSKEEWRETCRRTLTEPHL